MKDTSAKKPEGSVGQLRRCKGNTQLSRMPWQDCCRADSCRCNTCVLLQSCLQAVDVKWIFLCSLVEKENTLDLWHAWLKTPPTSTLGTKAQERVDLQVCCAFSPYRMPL